MRAPLCCQAPQPSPTRPPSPSLPSAAPQLGYKETGSHQLLALTAGPAKHALPDILAALQHVRATVAAEKQAIQDKEEEEAAKAAARQTRTQGERAPRRAACRLRGRSADARASTASAMPPSTWQLDGQACRPAQC